MFSCVHLLFGIFVLPSREDTLFRITPYPSSKLCSVCGYKNENLKLSDREWVYPNCGTKHDRDYNSTINLLKEGMKKTQGVAHLTSGRGGTPRTNARGECGCTR
ncbi:zinc ribbon domain-containing protein [Desulfurobacterium crinifex]